jgi:hypothetical protein
MYDIIFYYLYRKDFNKYCNKKSARHNGALVVAVALWFDIGVIVAIMEKVLKYNGHPKVKFYSDYKMLWCIFITFSIWLIYSFYNDKRVEKVKNKLDDKDWFNYYGGLLTLLFVFMPIITFAIILS